MAWLIIPRYRSLRATLATDAAEGSAALPRGTSVPHQADSLSEVELFPPLAGEIPRIPHRRVSDWGRLAANEAYSFGRLK